MRRHLNWSVFLALVLFAGTAEGQKNVQPIRISTPLPAASAANAGLLYWTYGNTRSDCVSGTGKAIAACRSNGTAWVPVVGTAFQGDAALGISENDGKVQFATAGPVDPLQSGYGICISNGAPPVASLCYSARQFIYTGSNDVILPSDCGNAVVYTVDPTQAATMNANSDSVATGLGTLQQCNVLLLNQSSFVVVASPDTTKQISGLQSVAIPPTKQPDNPFYLEAISDDASRGAWIIGRNNLISPLNTQVNGTNSPNQYRLNLAAGAQGMSVVPQADGATVNLNGLDIRFNGIPSVAPTTFNVTNGTNTSITKDAFGGARIDCSSCSAAVTGGHGYGFGSWSSLPPTCAVGDVFKLTGGGYDFAGCALVNGSPAWQTYSYGVPLTLPEQLGIQSWHPTVSFYSFGDIVPDHSQGYENMVIRNIGYNSWFYRTWNAPAAPFQTEAFFIPPGYFDLVGSRTIAFGLMDSVGAKMILICGQGSGIGGIEMDCYVAPQDATGISTGQLQLSTAFAANALWVEPMYSSGPGGQLILMAGYDGTKISLGLCLRPTMPCSIVYSETATAHLRDVSKFVYGGHWDSGSVSIYNASTTFFLGTYRAQ